MNKHDTSEIEEDKVGQYYKLVNLDKKELIDAWTMNSGAKFWEIANNLPAIWHFLLYKSSDSGGGDWHDAEDNTNSNLGRWAGDRVVLIGDYDDSDMNENVWDQEKGYTNISLKILEEYKQFVKWLNE